MIFNLNERLVWRGLYGDEYHQSISAYKFLKETTPFINAAFHSASGFYKKTVDVSIDYCTWCKEKDNSLNEASLIDLQKFFIGAIGEVFAIIMSAEQKSLYIPEKKSSVRFTDVRFNSELDYGVDLCGRITINKKSQDCVFQCKFWNPISDKKITAEMLAKAYAEGVERNYINPKQENNIVIFWLGDNSHVSAYCKKSPWYKHAIFIDKEVLDNPNNLGNTNTDFWKILKDKLNNLDNL